MSGRVQLAVEVYPQRLGSRHARTIFPLAGGQTGKIACMLPLNGHPAGGLEPFMKAAGVSCEAVKARFIGQDIAQKLRRYEVLCGPAAGYVLDVPLPDGTGPAPRASPCFEMETDCHLTGHADNVAVLAYRVGKSFGDSCRIGDARYVGEVAGHLSHLYEVSCQVGHDGELIEVDQFGALKSSHDCSKVKLVGGACQLKPGDAVDSRIVNAERAGSAPPPLPGAKLSVITNPDWIHRPTAREFENYYPLSAQRGRVNGRAVIGCDVAATGSLENCSIIDESPAGFGFGEAALKIAPYFKMRPQTRDGNVVSGARITIPINFAINRN